MEPAIIVHSGAGYFTDDFNASKLRITKLAARVGWEVLVKGDDPVDAVEQAVRAMEDDEACNAGKEQGIAFETKRFTCNPPMQIAFLL